MGNSYVLKYPESEIKSNYIYSSFYGDINEIVRFYYRTIEENFKIENNLSIFYFICVRFKTTINNLDVFLFEDRLELKMCNSINIKETILQLLDEANNLNWEFKNFIFISNRFNNLGDVLRFKSVTFSPI